MLELPAFHYGVGILKDRRSWRTFWTAYSAWLQRNQALLDEYPTQLALAQALLQNYLIVRESRAIPPSVSTGTPTTTTTIPEPIVLLLPDNDNGWASTLGGTGQVGLAREGGNVRNFRTLILNPLIGLLPYGEDELTALLSLVPVTTTAHCIEFGIFPNRKRANERLYSMYLKGDLRRTERNPWTKLAPHRPPFFYYTPSATETDIERCLEDYQRRFVAEEEKRAAATYVWWTCPCGYRVKRLKSHQESVPMCPTCKLKMHMEAD